MIAYKGFEPGLVCRGYQFQMGKKVTDQANCKENGFHCAENPLDCLNHYGNMDKSEYYVVNAGGDLDEDDIDSKISCTELTILKKLTREEFFLHCLAYMVNRPAREWCSLVRRDQGEAQNGYAVVRGRDPAARGGLGDILAFAKEDAAGKRVEQIALARVDGEKVLPNTWYGVDLLERREVA